MKMYILCIGKSCITFVINIFDIRTIVKGLASFFKLPGMCGIVAPPRVRVIECKEWLDSILHVCVLSRRIENICDTLCPCVMLNQCVL